jgi:hypothetical protein
LQGTLNRLTEYRKRDPRFKEAISVVANAEAQFIDDPAEGEPGEFVNGEFQSFLSPKRETESET